jgi:predicted amidohydrolase
LFLALNLAFALSLSAADSSGGKPVEFTLAALRVTPDAWDKEANLQKLDRFAREAARNGAAAVVTPESFLDGYVGNDSSVPRDKYVSVAEPIDGPSMARVRRLADELDIYLAVGFPEARDGAVFNTVAIFGPDGETVLRYSKTHCGSEPYNSEGVDFPIVKTSLGTWGVMICLDRQFPETARILAIKGAQLILNPSYGSYGEMNDAMMRTRAYENSVYVAFVHPKSALIVEPNGVVSARDAAAGDQIVYARILLDDRIGRGTITERRPEIYDELVRPRTLGK